MARYGTVGFSDTYHGTDERVAAIAQAGLKASLCEGLLAFEPKPYAEYPICAQNEEYVAKYHGAADGRILIDYNIHAEYTSNPQTCADIAAIAKEKGLRIHLHASETRSEHEECKQRHDGLTPIRYFESLGVLDVPVTAAHCVWADEGDIAILAERGVFVACNPASNMKLGSELRPHPGHAGCRRERVPGHGRHGVEQQPRPLPGSLPHGASVQGRRARPGRRVAQAGAHGGHAHGRRCLRGVRTAGWCARA